MNSDCLGEWRLAGIIRALAFACLMFGSGLVVAQARNIEIDDVALRNDLVVAVLRDLDIEIAPTTADTAFELVAVYGDQLQRHFNRNAYQIHAATYNGNDFTPFMIEMLHYIVRSLHLQDRLVQLLQPPLTESGRSLARYYLWLDGEFLKPTDPQTDEVLFDAAIAYVRRPRTVGDLHYAYTIGELEDDDLFVRVPAQSVIDRHFRIGVLPSAPFYFLDRKIEPLKDEMVDLNFQAFSDSLVGRDTAPLVEKLQANRARAGQ